MRRKSSADDGAMRQSALRLPSSLHDQLIQAGRKHKHGLGEEIRRRLEASFGAEAAKNDPETRKLLDAIAFVANSVAFDAPWSDDPYSFAILEAAIAELLARAKPEGDAPPSAGRVYGGPDDPAKTVGRMLVATALRAEQGKKG